MKNINVFVPIEDMPDLKDLAYLMVPSMYLLVYATIKIIAPYLIFKF